MIYMIGNPRNERVNVWKHSVVKKDKNSRPKELFRKALFEKFLRIRIKTPTMELYFSKVTSRRLFSCSFFYKHLLYKTSVNDLSC